MSNTEGSIVISGCKDTIIRIWSIGNISSHVEAEHVLTPSRVIEQHSSRVENIDIISNCGTNEEPLLVTACKDHLIRLFNLITGELVRELHGQNSDINSIKVYEFFDESNKYSCSKKTNSHHNFNSCRGVILSACSAGTVHVWDYSTGEVVRILNCHTDSCTSAVAVPIPCATKCDSNYNNELLVVTGSKDKTVQTWFYGEENGMTVLKHGKGVCVNTVAVYTRENREPIVVTGCDDCTLRCWQLNRSEQNGMI